MCWAEDGNGDGGCLSFIRSTFRSHACALQAQVRGWTLGAAPAAAAFAAVAYLSWAGERKWARAMLDRMH